MKKLILFILLYNAIMHLQAQTLTQVDPNASNTLASYGPNMYVGTTTVGLKTWNGTSWSTTKTPALPSNNILDIQIFNTGSDIALGTDNGAAIFTSSAWNILTPATLGIDTVKALRIDPGNATTNMQYNLWEYLDIVYSLDGGSSFLTQTNTIYTRRNEYDQTNGWSVTTVSNRIELLDMNCGCPPKLYGSPNVLSLTIDGKDAAYHIGQDRLVVGSSSGLAIANKASTGDVSVYPVTGKATYNKLDWGNGNVFYNVEWNITGNKIWYSYKTDGSANATPPHFVQHLVTAKTYFGYYDTLTASFNNYLFNGDINDLKLDNNGDIWLATSTGTYLFDLDGIPVVSNPINNNDTLSIPYDSNWTYKWYFDGTVTSKVSAYSPIGGADSNVYVPTLNGGYRVEITNEYGATNTSNYIFVDLSPDTTTAINEYKLGNEFNIYPIPNNGTFNIETNLDIISAYLMTPEGVVEELNIHNHSINTSLKGYLIVVLNTQNGTIRQPIIIY